MTTEIFREDAYVKQCSAVVTGCDERGLQFDQTIFYPTGGGQPGDSGTCTTADGRKIAITNAFKDRDSGDHIHAIDADSSAVEGLAVGDTIELELDWDRRHRLMRMHSCMHMLCAVIPAPVTGGSIQDGRGRLDFDLPETIDKEEVTGKLNELIDGDHPMTMRWITDEELAANPDLVRTMSAAPPTGTGRVRLVNFEGVDLQPCGGTHVASTGEIGKVRVQKVEKKGKLNRRITVVFDE
jgi:misacylated tRNA(Ala) deacylase